MGVVSGIVMPFQFGTNWSRYSDATANIVAPLMGYEGLTAFFLEAAFLGVLLFGRKLVPPWAHFASAFMVAIGTLFSTFWIIVLQQLDADAGRLHDRRRPVLRRPTGSRSCSIRHFRIAFSIRSPPFTSRRHSRSSVSLRITCGTADSSRNRR